MRQRPDRQPNAMTQRNLLLLAAVLAFSGAVLFLGCSSDEISSPAPVPDGSGLSSPAMALPPVQDSGGVIGAAEDGGLSGTSEAIASKVIDRKTGGSLRIEDVKLTFKPYTLEEDTEITIIKHPSDSDRVLFELLPHGIEFIRAVDLTVNLKDCGIDPDELATIYWWDPDKEEWVDLKAVWSYPNATVKLDHFSRYGGGRAGW